MKQETKVAVVGGGIVGCAVLRALAKRGWTEAVLLERLELTSGSTWHAAGNVTRFGHYAEITRLYADSLEIYQQAEAETGQSIDFHQTGSLRLATSQAELEAYRSLKPLYEGLGVPYRVIDGDEHWQSPPVPLVRKSGARARSSMCVQRPVIAGIWTPAKELSAPNMSCWLPVSGRENWRWNSVSICALCARTS